MSEEEREALLKELVDSVPGMLDLMENTTQEQTK